MKVTENREELFKAISGAQGEFTTVKKDKKNPFFSSKYAALDSIIEMVRPILPKHGLAVIQFTDIPEGGNGIIIETIITHESGQYISGKLLMPLAKVDPQGAGISITYGRRYALAAALGIVSDEDVDGNQPAGGTTTGKAEEKRKPAQEHASPPPAKSQKPAVLSDEQQKYFPRIKAALDTLYGDDTAAKKSEIKILTTFPEKKDGKETGKMVDGVDDYRKLDGKRLQILCARLEKVVDNNKSVVSNDGAANNDPF